MMLNGNIKQEMLQNFSNKSAYYSQLNYSSIKQKNKRQQILNQGLFNFSDDLSVDVDITPEPEPGVAVSAVQGPMPAPGTNGMHGPLENLQKQGPMPAPGTNGMHGPLEKGMMPISPASLIGKGVRNAAIGGAIGGGVSFLKNDPKGTNTPSKIKKSAALGAAGGIGAAALTSGIWNN